MYLEISGQKSGKTSRLVQAVKDWLNKSSSNRAIIVSPKVIEGMFVIENFEAKYFPNLLASDKMTDLPLETDNLKWFVDDFNDIEPEKLRIEKDGYFVTSVDGDPNPFVKKIIKANKGKFNEFAEVE